jgi:uncharacterized protein YbjT (DUF2867 family)
LTEADTRLHVLVLGSTGDQGYPQVAQAVAAGHRVRAAVRDAGRARSLLGSQVELSPVDYGEPATLGAAMRDVDVVLANYPSSSFNDGGWLLEAAEITGEAARKAGVRLIVFNTSLPQRDRRMDYPAHDIRYQMREALAASGVPVTTLAPVVFMGNLLRGWAFPHIADENRFVYPHRSELEVSWICQEDLAALMLAAAARPALAGSVVNVGGPQLLRGEDVASILSSVTGRTITFTPQPVDDFCAVMRAQLRSRDPAQRESMIEQLRRIYRWYNDSPERPFRVDMRPVLELLPVQLTTFESWARRQRWSR